jgi:hypothetical protein
VKRAIKNASNKAILSNPETTSPVPSQSTRENKKIKMIIVNMLGIIEIIERLIDINATAP